MQIATGMVRPKTAALFFDKLWVHPALIAGFSSDELEPLRVPQEVCLTNPIGAPAYYDSWERQRIYMASKWRTASLTDVTESYRRLALETSDERTIFEIEATRHFGEEMPVEWQRLKNQLPEFPTNDQDLELYISTRKRNEAIDFVVRLYAARGEHLTPIYLNGTDFESAARTEAAGLEVCIGEIPTVVDTASWQQILEFRHEDFCSSAASPEQLVHAGASGEIRGRD